MPVLANWYYLNILDRYRTSEDPRRRSQIWDRQARWFFTVCTIQWIVGPLKCWAELRTHKEVQSSAQQLGGSTVDEILSDTTKLFLPS